MATAALAEANGSYAPYSECPSGVCIADGTGALYSGCLIESAAYNPSVSPLHAALVNGLIKGLEGWEAVTHVVLVERPQAPVMHELTIAGLLPRICPRATFHTYHAKPIV